MMIINDETDGDDDDDADEIGDDDVDDVAPSTNGHGFYSSFYMSIHRSFNCTKRQTLLIELSCNSM